MTEQIGEIFIRKGKRYEGFSELNYGGILSIVGLFGIKSIVVTTCCMRGYEAEYLLDNNELILKSLYLVGHAPFPRVNGVRGKKSLRSIFRKEKYVTYKNINLKIPYTGQVSLQYEIGKDNNLMFNKGIELEEEIILEFNEGNLIKEI